MAWILVKTDEYEKRHKRLEKKRPRELEAVLDNLDTFFTALNAGAKPQQIHMGCIHPEPHGVLALDQKGGGKNLAQTRLYIYPDTETEIVYVITLGDKGTQANDIQLSSEFVAQLRRQKEQKQPDKKEPDTS
jgi:hypothetical protein